MSESRTNMRRGHGPMRGMGATEKAKDFKGTIGKLLAYIGSYKMRNCSCYVVCCRVYSL